MITAEKSQKNTNSPFQTVWYFLKPYKLQLGILLILSLLVGGLEAATVVGIYPILNAALDMGTTQTGILGVFQNLANLLPVEDEFVSFCIVFIAVATFAFLARLLNINYRTKFSANTVITYDERPVIFMSQSNIISQNNIFS